MIVSAEIAVLPSGVLRGMGRMATGPHQSTPPDVYDARRAFKDLALLELFRRGEESWLPWHLRQRGDDREDRHAGD